MLVCVCVCVCLFSLHYKYTHVLLLGSLSPKDGLFNNVTHCNLLHTAYRQSWGIQTRTHIILWSRDPQAWVTWLHYGWFIARMWPTWGFPGGNGYCLECCTVDTWTNDATCAMSRGVTMVTIVYHVVWITGSRDPDDQCKVVNGGLVLREYHTFTASTYYTSVSGKPSLFKSAP